MAAVRTAKQTLIKQIGLMLGGGLIDLDADTDTLNLAVDIALARYRQRSSNATEESFAFLSLTADRQEYQLPSEIIDVKKIYRRSFGTSGSTGSTSGTAFDPFSVAATNLYILQAGGQGGLATFSMYAGYVKEAGKLFGMDYIFNYNTTTHKLVINRAIRDTVEEVALHIQNFIPEDLLLQGVYSQDWLRRYATAQTKLMVGQAYSKFSTLPGPSGGVQLNGAELKSEAIAEMELLEKELLTYMDGSPQVYGILIG